MTSQQAQSVAQELGDILPKMMRNYKQKFTD
jgi:hypothetical protein